MFDTDTGKARYNIFFDTIDVSTSASMTNYRSIVDDSFKLPTGVIWNSRVWTTIWMIHLDTAYKKDRTTNVEYPKQRPINVDVITLSSHLSVIWKHITWDNADRLRNRHRAKAPRCRSRSRRILVWAEQLQ